MLPRELPFNTIAGQRRPGFQDKETHRLPRGAARNDEKGENYRVTAMRPMFDFIETIRTRFPRFRQLDAAPPAPGWVQAAFRWPTPIS